MNVWIYDGDIPLIICCTANNTLHPVCTFPPLIFPLLMNDEPGRAARIVIDIRWKVFVLFVFCVCCENCNRFYVRGKQFVFFLYFVFVLFYFKMVGEGDQPLLKRERFCICICVFTRTRKGASWCCLYTKKVNVYMYFFLFILFMYL